MTKFHVVLFAALIATACGSKAEEPIYLDLNNSTGNNGGTTTDTSGTTGEEEPPGIPLLGDGQHTVDAVEFAVVSTSAAGLNIPRDLAFHPQRTSELWVVNLGDNSTIVFDDPDDETTFERYAAAGKDHFMARPSALAFGENGNFATAQEEDELTQGDLTPEDFMGPTLWTSDRAIYDGGHFGHFDMLHNSPNGAGVAWERDNRYWIFDGWHESITMYDFHDDHGPGGSDHTDGEIVRYVEGEVSYVGDVPSHMEFDQATKLIYIADTGNNRIAVFDSTVGERGQTLRPNYDGCTMYAMNGGQIETLAAGADVMLELPSGLELRDGVVYVSDNKLSRIVAIDQQTGELIDYLDLADKVPTGGLMGMAFSQSGDLYAVNAVGNEIIRISPKL